MEISSQEKILMSKSLKRGGKKKMIESVFPERNGLLSDPLFSDDADLEGITSVHVSLCR